MGCSSRKNTSSTRYYHNLNSKYNSFYNAKKIYDETLEDKLMQLSEDWFELLPFYPNQNNNGKTQVGGAFDAVVDKLEDNIHKHSITAKPIRDRSKMNSSEYRKWLSQSEFNPNMKKVWLLLGKAHLQNGDYVTALSVFSEISKLFPEDTELITETHIWSIRAYTEMNRFYDADNLVRILQYRDMPKEQQVLFDDARANLFLKMRRYDDALPFISNSIRESDNIVKKKRLQFLLGQIYLIIGDTATAHKTFEELKDFRTPPILKEYANIYLDSTFVIKESVYNNSNVGLSDFPDDSLEHGATVGHYQFGNSFIAEMSEDEERLYSLAREAYIEQNTNTLHSLYDVFLEQYPSSNVMPQMTLMNAISFGLENDIHNAEHELKEIVEKYSNTDIANMANHVLAGLNDGHRIVNNKSWDYSTKSQQSFDEYKAIEFTSIDNDNYNILLESTCGNSGLNELIFAIANFNFTNFDLRTFKLGQISINEKLLLSIQSFYSMSDAEGYIDRLKNDSNFLKNISCDLNTIIISEENIKKISTNNDLKEYITFYNSNYKNQEHIKSLGVANITDETPLFHDTNITENKDISEEIKEGNKELEHNESFSTNGLLPKNPDELRKQLENKEQVVRERSTNSSNNKSRQQLLKERQKERERKIKQREKELKEIQRKREEELKLRHKNDRQR